MGPLGIPLPGTAQTLALFVTDLYMKLQLGTIQVYISAVSYLHHMNGHRSPASNNPMIKFLVEHSMPAATSSQNVNRLQTRCLGRCFHNLTGITNHLTIAWCSKQPSRLASSVCLGSVSLQYPTSMGLTLASTLPQRTSPCVGTAW